MISSCSPIKPNEANKMKKKMFASLLMFGLILVPTAYAATTQWYKDTAVTYLTTTHPELPESDSWDTWVISPVYLSPKPHRNVMIEYSGAYELTWTGHVYDDGSIETVTYSTNYVPPIKAEGIKFNTVIKNPQYRLIWDGSHWRVNTPNIYVINGVTWVVYPIPLIR